MILAVYQTQMQQDGAHGCTDNCIFEANDQMGVPDATVLQFQLNGISDVDDLADFNKDSLKQLVDNLHCPGGCIPDPNHMAVAGATIPIPAFVFGAKLQASNRILTPKHTNSVGWRVAISLSMLWMLSWEISIKQQQKIHLKRLKNTQQSIKDWLK